MSSSKVDKPIRCRHCNAAIAIAAPVIIGERPEERQARKVETLAHHLHACNPKALMSAVMAGDRKSVV